jgi:hypothetical protein
MTRFIITKKTVKRGYDTMYNKLMRQIDTEYPNKPCSEQEFETEKGYIVDFDLFFSPQFWAWVDATEGIDIDKGYRC